MNAILFVYLLANIHSSFNQAQYLFESFLSSILWFALGALCMHLVHARQSCSHRSRHPHRKERR